VERLLIDGSRGEGGGQILRTSLALSLVTGTPIRVENIRKGRSKPGLMRQHLACVEAAALVSQGTVERADLGATSVDFTPGSFAAPEAEPPRDATYTFSTGGAGSTTLVFQTVALALACRVNQPVRLIFTGGTHNPMAPPVDFLEHVLLPHMHAMGFPCEVRFDAYGFYPAGGGAWTAKVAPRLTGAPRFSLLSRGSLCDARITALLARLPANIGQREVRGVTDTLGLAGAQAEVVQVESAGPGNVISLALRYEHASERFYGFGERGVPAEKVASSLVQDARAFLAADVPVGEHLADQLLLPLALGPGGQFRMGEPSRHFTTQVETIKLFLDVHIEVVRDGGSYVVTVDGERRHT
jgi:RNA 3'-terminal phosphate cyclase (ATP)